MEKEKEIADVPKKKQSLLQDLLKHYISVAH